MKKIYTFLLKYKFPFLTVFICLIILVVYHNCARVDSHGQIDRTPLPPGSPGGISPNLGKQAGGMPEVDVRPSVGDVMPVAAPAQGEAPAAAADTTYASASQIVAMSTPTPGATPSAIVSCIDASILNDLAAGTTPQVTFTGAQLNAPYIESLTIYGTQNIRPGQQDALITWVLGTDPSVTNAPRTDNIASVMSAFDVNGKLYWIVNDPGYTISTNWQYIWNCGYNCTPSGVYNIPSTNAPANVLDAANMDFSQGGLASVRPWTLDDFNASTTPPVSANESSLVFAVVSCDANNSMSFYPLSYVNNGTTPNPVVTPTP